MSTHFVLRRAILHYAAEIHEGLFMTAHAYHLATHSWALSFAVA